jgi:hypothetical protein
MVGLSEDEVMDAVVAVSALEVVAGCMVGGGSSRSGGFAVPSIAR